MPKSQFHIDDRFLQDHIKDVKSDMAWRRELEFRLLQFLLVFYPVIGTAMIAFFESNVTSTVFWIVTAGASILIIVASLFASDRIRYEHFAYSELGSEVQKIWAHFGFFESGAYIKGETILPLRLREPGKGYGQGRGYRKTIALIWFISVSLILILFALAVIKSL